MSLNIRGSAPVQTRPTTHQSKERRNPSPTTTISTNSTSTRSSPQYVRPGIHLRNTDPGPAFSVSEASTVSVETQKRHPPAKQLRFQPPTRQFRPRQDAPTGLRSPPEPFTPRGAHASESDTESAWSASDISVNTQATSVISDDGIVRRSDKGKGPAVVRPTVHARSISASAGPSRRPAESTDGSVQNERGVVHIHIKSNQQQQKALPPASSKSAASSRKTPMITQAPHRATSDYDSDASMQSEIDALKGEVKLLRDNDSRNARDLVDAQRRVKDLQQDKDDLRAQKMKLEAIRDTLEAELEDESKQLDKTQVKFDEQKKTIKELEKERDSKLEKAKKERSMAIQKIHKERDQTQERLEKENEDAIKKLEEERNQLAQNNKSVEDKLKDAEELLSRYRELNENLDKKCKSLELETQDNSAVKKQFEAKSINLERELRDTVAIKMAQDSSHIAKIARLEIALEARDLRVQNLEDELAKSTAECAELTGERDKLKLDLQEQTGHANLSKEESTGLRMDKAELQKRIDELKEEKAGVETSLETSKEESKTELGGKDASIATLEGEVTDLKAQLDTAKEELDAAQQKIEEAEAAQNALKEQLEQAQKEQDDTSAEADRLKDECNGLRNENESLRDSSDTSSQAASDAEQSLRDKAAEFAARGTELQAKLATTEQQLNDEKKAHGTAEKKATALKKQVTELTTQLKQAKAKSKSSKKDPNKKQVLTVRCPREDLFRDLSIVRRKT